MRNLLLLLFALIGTFYSPSSHAFQYWVCKSSGTVAKWKTSNVTMKRLSSIQSFGAVDGLKIVEENWSLISRANFNFVDATDNDSTINLGGGDGNEVAFISEEDFRREVGGMAAAATVMKFSSCNDGGKIKEADMIFPSIPQMGGPAGYHMGAPDPQTCSGVSNYHYYDNCAPKIFRFVALHELGHVLGLAHTSLYAVMNGGGSQGGWYPGYGPRRALPHGDDRRGIQYLYPGSGTSKIDIAVINFYRGWSLLADLSQKRAVKWVKGVLGHGLEPDGSTEKSQVVCPGDEFEAQYNFGNPGDVSVAFILHFYLSWDKTWDSSDVMLGSESWTSGSGAYSYEAAPIRKFRLPAGLSHPTNELAYYFLVVADPGNLISEVRETNNAVAVPGKLKLKPLSQCASVSGSGY